MTPSNVDTFSRFMAGLFDDRAMITIAKGFQAFFGRPETGSETIFSMDKNVVDIDIQRGNKKIAALIPRGNVSRPLGSKQKNLKDENYSTFSRKYPLAEEEADIQADKLIERMAGESPYAATTRFNRLRILAGRKTHENIRRIGDMFEVLAAQSVLEGIQDAIIGTTNTDEQYNFQRRAAHIVTVANAWDSGSQTILPDIDDNCDKIKTNGRVIPDFIGMGGGAMNAFLADTDVKDKADNRRFELIMINDKMPVPSKFARFVNAGWTPRGRLMTPKGYELWMFTYLNYTEDASGTPVDLLPTDQAIIASTQARADRYFGPPELLPMTESKRRFYTEMFGFSQETPPAPMGAMDGSIIMPEMFYHDAYAPSNWKRLTVRTQSAPIFATTMTDAFVTLKGLLT